LPGAAEFDLFSLIDLGPFAVRVGAGVGPALLSLGMLLTYSIVLGTVYVALELKTR
jgi:hypothetical protein